MPATLTLSIPKFKANLYFSTMLRFFDLNNNILGNQLKSKNLSRLSILRGLLLAESIITKL